VFAEITKKMGSNSRGQKNADSYEKKLKENLTDYNL